MFTVESSDGCILMVEIGFMITIKSSDVRMFYHFFCDDRKWGNMFRIKCGYLRWHLEAGLRNLIRIKACFHLHLNG